MCAATYCYDHAAVVLLHNTRTLTHVSITQDFRSFTVFSLLMFLFKKLVVETFKVCHRIVHFRDIYLHLGSWMLKSLNLSLF